MFPVSCWNHFHIYHQYKTQSVRCALQDYIEFEPSPSKEAAEHAVARDEDANGQQAKSAVEASSEQQDQQNGQADTTVLLPVTVGYSSHEQGQCCTSVNCEGAQTHVDAAGGQGHCCTSARQLPAC